MNGSLFSKLSFNRSSVMDRIAVNVLNSSHEAHYQQGRPCLQCACEDDSPAGYVLNSSHEAQGRPCLWVHGRDDLFNAQLHRH